MRVPWVDAWLAREGGLQKAGLIIWLEVDLGFELDISKCSQEVRLIGKWKH